jgi:hypothetical protein
MFLGGTRTRNNGLAHVDGGALSRSPTNSAFPRASRGTAAVSTTACVLVPGLQTRVPLTLVTPSGVPLALPPTRTSPSTKNAISPVCRFTTALPSDVVQGNPPLAIPATGFETPGAVMTPTILCQCTTASSPAKDAVANNRGSSTASTLFMVSSSFLVKRSLGIQGTPSTICADATAVALRLDDGLFLRFWRVSATYVTGITSEIKQIENWNTLTGSDPWIWQLNFSIAERGYYYHAVKT